MHRGLGDPVHVDQLRTFVFSVDLQPRDQRGNFESFPAEDHRAEGIELLIGLRGLHGNEAPERGGRLVEDRDALAAQQLEERLRRTAHPVRDDHELAAMEQGPP